MQRKGNRRADEIREISIQRGFIKHAEGSVLIDMGDTRIICTASIIDGAGLLRSMECCPALRPRGRCEMPCVAR